jgi:tRNA U55 pseudouridine synthase TruB
VTVTLRQLEMLACEGDRLTVTLTCSAGFYVRALAHDLGARLGIGAHLDRLRRTRSGPFSETDALPLDVAERDAAATAAAVVPLGRMLMSLSAVVLTEEGVRHAVQGRNLGAPDFEHGQATPDRLGESSPRAPRERIRLVDLAGTLVGIAEATGPSGLLHPFVVLV